MTKNNKSSQIFFLLDDALTVIDFRDGNGYTPTTTVLQYLRSLSGHKGVKEGCGEGDCGACTIVLAELNMDGELEYNAYNSCLLFLPQLDGKYLITVENLIDGEHLHPVQAAIVGYGGSQCGYCTPGFVMALFACYKNQKKADDILYSLSGNLCRCTGYKSIAEAAIEISKAKPVDHFTEKEKRIMKELTVMEQMKSGKLLMNADWKYFLPASLDEALRLRKKYLNAKLLNGGTDLALIVSKLKQKIPEIIDLSSISALKKIEKSTQGLRIGSGTSLESLKSFLTDEFPALSEALTYFASLQIRNRATLGGNIGSASPIGDALPVLMSYEAELELTSERRIRSLKLVDFITGYRTTLLEKDELITAIIIPFSHSDSTHWFHKISKRTDLDISTVSAGFRLQKDASGIVTSLDLFYGGMAEKTKKATLTERYLTGKLWSFKTINQALEYIDLDFTPLSDARSGAEGRKLMARNLLVKFWTMTNSKIIDHP